MSNERDPQPTNEKASGSSTADPAGAQALGAQREGTLASPPCAKAGATPATPSPPNQKAHVANSQWPVVGRGGDQEPLAISHKLLAGVSEVELGRLNDLAEQLRRAESAPREQRAWIAQKLGLTLSTLDRKIRALRRRGISALRRRERKDKGASRVADPKIVARIKAEYLKPWRPPATEIHRAIVKDYEMSGLKPPSYSFVRRTIKTIDPDLTARFRIGEKYYDDKFAYYTQRKKPPLPRQWCDADHHPCDHYVIFPDGSIGRPWLTAIQDICTNEILGFRLTKYKPVGKGSYPGAIAIGLCLRHALLKKPDPLWPSSGVFESLYADLGRDFRSQYIRAVCADLSIKVVHARGYHGKSKPIERWFGVMELPLGRLPGYCGNNPQNNPERQRIGPPRSPEEMRGELLAVEQYEAAVYDWIVKDFHHRESRALHGLSPIAALETHIKNGWAPREVASERTLDLLLMQRKKKPVQRRGIEMFGTKYQPRFFGAPELLELTGQEVEVYWDPANIGEIIVYKDNRFLCKATNRELLDFAASEEMVEQEREIRRQQQRRLQERYDELIKQAQYPNALARAAAESRHEKILDDERRKIAANAEPSKRVYKLLPKFQLAEKAMKVVKAETKAGPAPEQNPWLAEEPPARSEDIFKREKNPWLDGEDV